VVLYLDEELKAINVLYDALKQMPQSYALLHVQADFLRGKGKLEMALRLAKQAVNLAPSEFITWAKLTEVYIDLGDYESVSLHCLCHQKQAQPVVHSTEG
jgi:predicted Zn-dependent protease